MPIAGIVKFARYDNRSGQLTLFSRESIQPHSGPNLALVSGLACLPQVGEAVPPRMADVIGAGCSYT